MVAANTEPVNEIDLRKVGVYASVVGTLDRPTQAQVPGGQRSRSDALSAVRALGVELANETVRADLAFVLAAVVAGAHQRSGSASVADAELSCRSTR